MAIHNMNFARDFKRVWSGTTGHYWTAVAALTVLNSLILGATSAIAGLSVEAFTSGAREVVMINVFALTLLVWPTMSLMMKGLHSRRKWCCWGAVTHGLAVFVLMEAYFGKPFGLASGSVIANLAPTMMFMGLSAWLMVEWRVSRKTSAVSVS